MSSLSSGSSPGTYGGLAMELRRQGRGETVVTRTSSRRDEHIAVVAFENSEPIQRSGWMPVAHGETAARRGGYGHRMG